MTTYDAIVHVGSPKTGSSSIQRALSYNSVLSGPGGKFQYMATAQNGGLLSGADIEALARKNAYDYVQSFHDISKAGLTTAASRMINELRSRGVNPIFSQEDWFRQAPQSTSLMKCFKNAHVIMYVRPHLEWFNAAWFQWLRWEKEFDKPEDVLAKWGRGFVKFGNAADTWKGIPGVAKVSVRLMPKDVVADFCQLIGVRAPQKDEDVNASLDLSLIKLIDMLGGRSPHEPAIDFRIARYFLAAKKPWAITRGCGEEVLSRVRSDAEALLKLLPADQADLMKNDSRWWSFSAYEHHTIADETAELSREECLLLLKQATRALLNIDKKNRPSEGWP